ncbi:MAG: hypothetical protein LBQ39_05420 [Tannerellaceae bacterium]|jgi:hypothetical protein|nr:hypothetical protein [Tannerellaceae bacterium]
MKRLIFLIGMAAGLFFPGCDDTVRETIQYMINEPVVMTAAEFRSLPIRTKAPQEIETQGKICFYEGYLYICEPGKGIHIIDNRNPASPVPVGFIELLGNADVAIRHGKLYADAHVDLVWFDISNPAQPQLLGRVEELFREVLPSVENEYGYDYNMCMSAKEKGNIVIGWTLKQRSEEVVRYRDNGEYLHTEMSPASDSGSGAKAGGANGVNGSMSRFGLYKDYLYAVINYTMTIIDLSGAEPVKAADEIYVGEVETIFSYEDNLFLGAPTGMSIYSVKNPLSPQRMSTVWHVYGCDPVVVENDLAYVTVHSGNACGQNNNELLIIDVSNVSSPKPLVSYAMTKPKGLGIDNGVLFLCDDGLKIYKVGDPQQLMANRLVHFSDMEGYDVIPYNQVLMMIAEDGLYQYDYSDLEEITLLSRISVGK